MIVTRLLAVHIKSQWRLDSRHINEMRRDYQLIKVIMHLLVQLIGAYWCLIQYCLYVTGMGSMLFVCCLIWEVCCLPVVWNGKYVVCLWSGMGSKLVWEVCCLPMVWYGKYVVCLLPDIGSMLFTCSLEWEVCCLLVVWHRKYVGMGSMLFACSLVWELWCLIVVWNGNYGVRLWSGMASMVLAYGLVWEVCCLLVVWIHDFTQAGSPSSSPGTGRKWQLHG